MCEIVMKLPACMYILCLYISNISQWHCDNLINSLIGTAKNTKISLKSLIQFIMIHEISQFEQMYLCVL